MNFRRRVTVDFTGSRESDGQEMKVQSGELIYTDEPEDHRHIKDARDSPVRFIRDCELISKEPQQVYAATYWALQSGSHPDPCGHLSKEKLAEYKMHCKDCNEVLDMPICDGGPFRNG